LLYVGLCFVLNNKCCCMCYHRQNTLHQICMSQINNDNIHQSMKIISNDDNIHLSSCVARKS
jgi:hypothetical protein